MDTSAADRETPSAAHRIIIVSGLSGSGKTVALRTLEDLGYYCVDNLPVELIPNLVDALAANKASALKLVVGVDVRNKTTDLSALPAMLGNLAERRITPTLVFLDTRDEVLIKRFADTRRRHPLVSSTTSLGEAIRLERKLLKPIVAIADKTVDTSDFNIHQLRRSIATELGADGSVQTLLFESFAYKRGLPHDADFVFDARCLPNPHWDPILRPFSGRDEAVRKFFGQNEETMRFMEEIRDLLERWLPRFAQEQRNYLTVCIGCTGGRHRSVYLVERLAEFFRLSNSCNIVTFHRELE